MFDKFKYYFYHDRFFKFLTLFVATSFLGLSLLLVWMPSDRVLRKRKEAMKNCVEIKIFPTQGQTEYEIRFEDKFFCPTKQYTALEALTRAELVFNVRNKPIHLVFNDTPQGVFLVSILGKASNSIGKWELEINSNEKITKPLDKVFLQGPSFINFYYR